jgi:hypothetical protein
MAKKKATKNPIKLKDLPGKNVTGGKNPFIVC